MLERYVHVDLHRGGIVVLVGVVVLRGDRFVPCVAFDLALLLRGAASLHVVVAVLRLHAVQHDHRTMRVPAFGLCVRRERRLLQRHVVRERNVSDHQQLRGSGPGLQHLLAVLLGSHVLG